MSQSDRDKWNQKYREGEYSTRKHPTVLLEAWLPRLTVESEPPRAMDVGCGLGRNSLYLARRGWHVVAVDVSEVALEKLGQAAADENLPITCLQRDLETVPASPEDPAMTGPYDLVIMIRYTNVPLIGPLKSALVPGGYLLVEEHMDTEAEVVGPRESRFRVAPGQLREAAGDFEVIHYQEGLLEDPDHRPVALAQLVARRPGGQ